MCIFGMDGMRPYQPDGCELADEEVIDVGVDGQYDSEEEFYSK